MFLPKLLKFYQKVKIHQIQFGLKDRDGIDYLLKISQLLSNFYDVSILQISGEKPLLTNKILNVGKIGKESVVGDVER